MESGPRRDSPIVEPPPDRHLPPDEEAAQVMSESHLGCPPGYSGPHISRFAISLPSYIKGDSLWTENDDAVDEDLTSSSGACDLDENGDKVKSFTPEPSTFPAPKSIVNDVNQRSSGQRSPRLGEDLRSNPHKMPRKLVFRSSSNGTLTMCVSLDSNS